MALDDSVVSERANALAGWTLVGLMSLGGVGNVLAGTLLWGGFWLVFVGILSIPALVTRSWVAVVPWPLPAIAALSLVAREAGVYPESAGHLAVVALALAVVVELDVFTPVELSRRFAVVFGIDDIVTDLVFNAVGAMLVAVWGTGYLGGLVGFFRNRLRTNSSESQ